MMRTKTTAPSRSYQLDVPRDAHEAHEATVSSFWRDGEPVLLQLSSYARHEGPQVSAQVRMAERVAMHDCAWRMWDGGVQPDPAVDQAVGEFTDEGGLVWVHCYLVWPRLTVYAIISGAEELVHDKGNWAFQALRSARPASS